MIVKLCLSILIPLSIAFLLIHTILPFKKPSPALLMLKICIAVGLGFGITSCSYFLVLLLIGPRINNVIISEAGLFILIAIIFSSYGKTLISSANNMRNEKTLHDFKLKRILSIGFCSAFILGIINFINMALHLPHGGWDAWAIWNLHARFIYRGGEYWRYAFSSLLDSNHHPDYPLLVPLSVSRCWLYIGKETQAVPILIAMLFTFATVGMLYSALTVLKSKSQGIFAGLFLLGTANFIILGTLQLADVPIGFYFLSSVVLVFIQDRFPEKYGISFLSGIMAGFSGWTKNEGLLFIVSFLIAHTTVTFLSRNWKNHMKQLMYFTVGLIPVLAVILYFKLNLSPPSDLISGEREIGDIMLKLKDYSRYAQILKRFLLQTFSTLPYLLLLLLYLMYFGSKIEDKNKRSILTVFITIVLVMSGYFLVYLITPYELNWHLESSLQRLLLQLWPSVLFTCFMIVRTPEEALMSGEAKVTS